jgi:poly(3-hydroxybutyrate) depolymerase
MFGLLVAAAVFTSSAVAAEPVLTAGQESSVALSPSNGTMKVYLPSNYAGGQKWPVLFCYHGMGGSPDTTLMRKFTDGRNYIVVGMPYLEGDTRARTVQEQEAYMRREQANFHLARSWLIAHASVDEARIFMSGASKGGWMTSSLGEMELPQIAGLVVCLAGRQPGSTRPLTLPAIRNKPVYVGAGETDTNLVPALRAAGFYKKSGAIVTFEEYAGHGHEMPSESKKLHAWLEVNGVSRQPTNQLAIQKEWTSEIKGSLKSAMTDTNAMVQYGQLHELVGDPRLNLCDQAVVEQVKTQFASLTKSPPARDEWNAEAAFNDLIYREGVIRSLAEMQSVVEGFRNLVKTCEQTHYGKLASQFLPNLEEAYKKSVDATAKANEGKTTGAATNASHATAPSFPTGGFSGDPRLVPVRKGNTITFKPPGAK